MRQFLNSLFVLSEDAYLTLDGENVVVSRGKAEVGRCRCTRWKASSASVTPVPAPR